MVHIVLAPAFAITKVTARYYSIGVGVEDGEWVVFVQIFFVGLTPPPPPFTYLLPTLEYILLYMMEKR